MAIDVSHHSTLTSGVGFGSETFNVSQNSTLNVNMYTADVTVNISGKDTVHITGARSNVTVNIADHSRWVGNFQFQGEFGIDVHGGANAVFSNDGASSISPFRQGGGHVSVDADVTGKGSFSIASVGGGLPGPSEIHFLRSVGPNQSITNGGLLVTDDPTEFKAAVTLKSSGIARPSEIDLNNLVNAESYSIKNDLLSIYGSNGKVIDTLRFTDNTNYGCEVEKVSSGVSILAYTDASHTNVGTPLPLHAGS